MSLFISGFGDLYGEIPALGPAKAQEMLRGLSFLYFSQALMTLMKEWKEGLAG